MCHALSRYQSNASVISCRTKSLSSGGFNPRNTSITCVSERGLCRLIKITSTASGQLR